MQKRKKHGGRKAGTPNKVSRSLLSERLDELGFDPEEALIRFAMNEVPCTSCDDDNYVSAFHYLALASRTSKHDRDLADDDPTKLRECPCCGGSGNVNIEPEVSLKAIVRINDSRSPKLASKTVEKTVRSITVKRMNNMSRKAREEAEQNLKEQD